MVEYKRIKSRLMFKLPGGKRYRPVYGSNNRPSSGFAKAFRAKSTMKPPPNFNFVLHKRTGKFLSRHSRTLKTLSKKKHRYLMDGCVLANKGIHITEWKSIINDFYSSHKEEWLNMPKGRPITINLTSAVENNVHQEFVFRDYCHFENWYDNMMEHQTMSKSPVSEKYKDVIGKYGFDVMSCAVVDVDWTNGGCYRCDNEKILHGSYNSYEVFNPISRRNNCGLQCLRAISTCKLPTDYNARIHE